MEKNGVFSTLENFASTLAVKGRVLERLHTWMCVHV
jgi:hypothetical protein